MNSGLRLHQQARALAVRSAYRGWIWCTRTKFGDKPYAHCIVPSNFDIFSSPAFLHHLRNTPRDVDRYFSFSDDRTILSKEQTASLWEEFHGEGCLEFGEVRLTELHQCNVDEWHPDHGITTIIQLEGSDGRHAVIAGFGPLATISLNAGLVRNDVAHTGLKHYDYRPLDTGFIITSETQRGRQEVIRSCECGDCSIVRENQMRLEWPGSTDLGDHNSLYLWSSLDKFTSLMSLGKFIVASIGYFVADQFYSHAVATSRVAISMLFWHDEIFMNSIKEPLLTFAEWKSRPENAKRNVLHFAEEVWKPAAKQWSLAEIVEHDPDAARNLRSQLMRKRGRTLAAVYRSWGGTTGIRRPTI